MELLRSVGAGLKKGEAEWSGEREKIHQFWSSFLGPLPTEKAALRPQFFEKEDCPNFTRQRVVYQVEEGIYTDAVLLVPKASPEPLPAVVIFHPTYQNHYRRIVGFEGDEEPERQQALQLVECGYVVIAPRCFLWSDIPEGYQRGGENTYAARVRQMQEKHPDWKGLTRMLWDGIRTLDLVETLPYVDTSRIGIFGHSLGAKEVLYLAAFDSRPKCIVFSEGGIGMGQSNWQDVWYLGPSIQSPDFTHDHHELLALIAPKPFLLLAGGEGRGAADTLSSWHYIEAVLPVYEHLKAGQNIGWFNHGLGHRYGGEARTVAEKFLAVYLKGKPGNEGR